MAERRIWYITRSERDPNLHAEALEALREATEEFKEPWLRNRTVHKRYEEILSVKRVKKDKVTVDGSGGRTWAAMLRAFGYIYIGESGRLHVTKVGIQLLRKENQISNIIKQILTFQIPNAYFMESSFRPKFEEGFQVRPVQFLIRLVADPKLDYYVTKEEITFFVLTVKQDSDFQTIAKRIIVFRKSALNKKEEMKKEVADKYSHQKRSVKGVREYATAYGGIAHTFMILCDYTGLVEYIRGDALRLPSEKRRHTAQRLAEFEERYPFNKRYLISLQRFSENAGLDVTSCEANSFKPVQCMFSQSRIQKLLASYPLLQGLPYEKIVGVLKKEFSNREAEEYASLLEKERFGLLNEEFIEEYLLEKDDRAFESKTTEVLRAIGFEVDLLPNLTLCAAPGGIKIVIHLDSARIGVIAVENSREKFILSARLASCMASEHVSNFNGYKGKKVSHFGYITASDWSGDHNLNKISVKAINIGYALQGAIMSASALLGFLDFCVDNNIKKENRTQLFINCFVNKGYTNVSEMIQQDSVLF